LLIADGTNYFRSVATFSRNWRNKTLHSLRLHCGNAHVAMDQWLCWNDFRPASFSTQNGGNNASLIARRGRTPLAITADLSTHLLEVRPAAVKALSLRIDDSPWPTSAHPPTGIFDLLSSPRPALLSRFAPKIPIENT
jgi:hypothetical protein